MALKLLIINALATLTPTKTEGVALLNILISSKLSITDDTTVRPTEFVEKDATGDQDFKNRQLQLSRGDSEAEVGTENGDRQ